MNRFKNFGLAFKIMGMIPSQNLQLCSSIILLFADIHDVNSHRMRLPLLQVTSPCSTQFNCWLQRKRMTVSIIKKGLRKIRSYGENKNN